MVKRPKPVRVWVMVTVAGPRHLGFGFDVEFGQSMMGREPGNEAVTVPLP
jgi:hypothetical protein